MAGSTILIVDDEPHIAEVLSYNLAKEGFRTIVAEDGARALALVAQHAPDLVILDWMLPEIDGLEVCRHLKRQDTTRHIPIIMVSVRGDETDKILISQLRKKLKPIARRIVTVKKTGYRFDLDA